jgi:hypothetical protein
LRIVSGKANDNVSEGKHADANHIELEASLQQLLFNLLSDAVKTNMASGENSVSLGHCGRHDGPPAVA